MPWMLSSAASAVCTLLITASSAFLCRSASKLWAFFSARLRLLATVAIRLDGGLVERPLLLLADHEHADRRALDQERHVDERVVDRLAAQLDRWTPICCASASSSLACALTSGARACMAWPAKVVVIGCAGAPG